MSQYSVFLDVAGNLTMQAGMVQCLHGTTTYFAAGGGQVSRVPAPVGDPTVQRLVPGQFSFHGGSGRNFIVSGGPSNPALPKGYFLPVVPDEWKGPQGAQIFRDPGTGAISLNDGTGDLATGPGFGGLVGTPSAGTYPITDWVLSAYYPGTAAYYDAPGYPLWVMGHDLVSGDVLIQFGVDVMLSRIGGSTTDPSGVFTASPAAEVEYNGGSPWTYTVAGGSLSGTLTATTYGEDTYNGGSGFSLTIDAESDLPAWPKSPVEFTPFSGTAQAGLFTPTGWQGWQSEDDPDWSMELDGSGAGEISDGIDTVATRAADVTKLYDPSGTWTATSYGEANYGAGEAWAGDVTVSLAAPMAGFLYVILTVDGSNEVTAVSDPLFGASVPTNTSTEKVFIIAECDGAGGIVQVQEGPIIWIP